MAKACWTPSQSRVRRSFPLENVRLDQHAAHLHFRPQAFNTNFFQSEALDLYRAGAFIETAAIDSPESLWKGFTPYHLLMTLGGSTQPLLPARDLSANQLRRLIENFGWLLHISVHDSGLLLPEHSPLAWILNQVLLFLNDTPFCQAWSKLGDQHVKYSYGFLRSIAELWEIHDFRVSTTFSPLSSGSIFIMPISSAGWVGNTPTPTAIGDPPLPSQPPSRIRQFPRNCRQLTVIDPFD
jgi:hypothetical protein